MTLYTYVPGKDELVDVMLDAAYQRMPRSDTAGQPWRPRLTAIADANRALYLTHPWASTVSTQRPPLGPGLMANTSTSSPRLTGSGSPMSRWTTPSPSCSGFVQANAQAANDARVRRGSTT